MASSQAKGSSSSGNRTVSTKQVHPVTLSSFAPTGCELSTWAYITLPRPSSSSPSSSENQHDSKSKSSSVSLLPNLVTAHANSLKIYVVDPIGGALILASTYDNLAGTITTLNVLPHAAGTSSKEEGVGGTGISDHTSSQSYDGLLIGFSGQPRMSIVYPPGGLDAATINSAGTNTWSGVLTASSIIDLTPILIERSLGSVAPLEQDLTCSVTEDGKVPTVAVIVGGGVSIATFQLPRSNYAGTTTSSSSTADASAWWRTASEPYTLPLSALSAALPDTKTKTTSATSALQHSKYNKYHTATQQNALTISHGFGDILSSAFLRGYTEPVLTILHSSPHGEGRACPGRLGHRTSATRSPLSLTAISISILQKRSVVLWSLPECIPADAYELHPHPKGGVLVVGANEVLYVDCAGKIQCCTAMNGWVRATGSAALLPNVGSVGGIMQPNPSPLAKLGVQLDGSRMSFVNEDVALVSLRDGSLYSLEFHGEDDCIGVGGGGGVCISLSPVGKKLGGLGMISTLSVLPLVHVQTSFAMGKLLDKGSVSAKKEEIDSDAPSKGQVLKENASSLGLIFAGSRMGDSMLIMYDLKEKIKLVPLERDKEQEKIIADAVELSEQSSKRKRDEEDDVVVKKEKLEGNVDEPTTDAAVKEEDKQNGSSVIAVSDDSDDEANLSEEEVLRREEEALYALDADEGSMSAIIPDGDDRNETLLPGITPKQLYRPQILSMSVFQNTKILDCLTGLGPIGQGCIGPTVGKESADTSLLTNITKSSGKGSISNVHPCGFGTSGGLAVLTAPGLNTSSTIVSETDCLDIGSIFPCPNLGYFFVVKKLENAGCMIMRLAIEDGERRLEEIDITTILEEGMDVDTPMPSFESVRDVLTRMNIVSVKEFTSKNKAASGDFVMLMARYGSAYALIILSHSKGIFSIEHSHFIGAYDDGNLIERESLVSASFVEHLDKSRFLSAGEDLSLACVWSTGLASTFSISYNGDWVIREVLFDKVLEGESTGGDVKNEDDEANKFYQDNSIVAVDIFAIADSIFETEGENVGVKCDKDMSNPDSNDVGGDLKFDEDDLDLYGEDEIGDMTDSPKAGRDVQQPADLEASSQMAPSRYNTLGGYISGAGLSASSKVVVALSRRSGQLEIYDVAKLFEGSPDESMVQYASDLKAKALLWSSNNGFGQGAIILDSSKSSSRRPRTQESCAAEIRFFFSGPSNTTSGEGETGDLSVLRSLCLLVETNQGDVNLYTASKSNASNRIAFKRVSLHNVARQSKDEGKHRNKLQRKGFSKESESDLMFRPNRLHRFFSVSGEDGLFAATTRPQWFLSERGAPSALYHRLRHCAPAGGADVPVFGFCSGFSVDDDGSDVGFITVHARVGRVGSQRLTLFNGLSDVFTPRGLMPGGGMSVEKILLGVTVREIHYVDDPAISTASHPVYALLVSREIDVNQSALMDDGLTPEQRQEVKNEKEHKRMAKQVEADLGGFDVEQEWVEEIERDDCFEIEKRYGGAPPMPQSKYEVWIMDSANWQILDTYQLEEYEQGMSMSVMTLSDIAQDTSPGNANAEESVVEDINVIAVGTGIVDEDGEDVSSKGRIILFQLKRVGDRTGKFELELNFFYDKEISLGPVTSVGCLIADGKSRMVVGAGAEINIEQWGNSKLTQVGFFHCYMQVQDVVIFKNFLILSDAYNSLHFLVWRESDMSLTLLAKDYEPTSMYAAGLLSRGGTLSFVCHDDRQNLSFLSYAPGDLASRGGNKLVCRADCHLGTQTTALTSHVCRSSLVINSATTESTLVALKQQDPLFGKLDDDKRFGLHYGSTDGGFGTIMPVSEGIYWRLAALQSVMSNALESDCSLSQRAWRLFRRAPRRGGCRSNDRKKGVVDGDLVMKYADLPITEQEDLASAIGSTVDLILDNLLEVGVSNMVV